MIRELWAAAGSIPLSIISVVLLVIYLLLNFTLDNGPNGEGNNGMITENSKCTSIGYSVFNTVSLGFISSAACTFGLPSAEMPGAHFHH